MQYCPHCRIPQPDELTVCPACGTALTAEPEPAPAETAEPSPAAEPTPAPCCEPQAAAEAAETSPAEANGPAAANHAELQPAPDTPPADGRIRFEAPPAARTAPSPRYGRVLPQQPDGGLTTAQYFWTLVLFGLPLVGLGFMLYWSFGSTASPARQRLARACLIKAGAGILSAVASLLLLAAVLVGMAQSMRHPMHFYEDFYGYYEDFEDFTHPGNPFWDFFVQEEPPRV